MTRVDVSDQICLSSVNPSDADSQRLWYISPAALPPEGRGHLSVLLLGPLPAVWVVGDDLDDVWARARVGWGQ